VARRTARRGNQLAEEKTGNVKKTAGGVLSKADGCSFLLLTCRLFAIVSILEEPSGK